MGTSEYAQVGSEQAADFRFRHWPAVRIGALVLYFLALVVWTANYGIPVQRELVIAWTCGALVCVSIGRHPRQILQLALDWAPIVVILIAYDFTRGAADSFGIGVNYTAMIDFDKFLFLGETPTEWLQAQLYEPAVVHWYDVAFTLIYTSYFISPFALLGWLWARERLAFLRFRKRVITLALAGLATYILYPAAPPWMAGEMGLLEEVHRTTAKGWEVMGVGTASWFSKGQGLGNAVAAVPSLHSAFVALVVMFLWSRVRWGWRPLLALYPLAMGVALMATGEHYFFDVALGWLYAGAVLAGWSAWERRRARVEAPPASAKAPSPAVAQSRR